jgi:hypothetical protein
VADRTSANLFSVIFELLAENPSEEHKTMAKKIWKLTRNFDFSFDQMGCDAALVTLGLARLGVDSKYPEDGEVVIYAK